MQLLAKARRAYQRGLTRVDRLIYLPRFEVGQPVATSTDRLGMVVSHFGGRLELLMSDSGLTERHLERHCTEVGLQVLDRSSQTWLTMARLELGKALPCWLKKPPECPVKR